MTSLFLFLLGFSLGNARASPSFLLVPERGTGASARDAAADARIGVEGAEPVFSAEESAILRRHGLGDLAGSLKVRLQSGEDAARVGRRLRARGLRLDPNEGARLRSQGDPGWAFENRGEGMRILRRYDWVHSDWVTGKKGEDIGLARAGAPPVKRAVRVAILDSGIDAAHPALRSRIEKCWSIVSQSGNAEDKLGHGTHVAGLVARVAPEARLLPIQVTENGSVTPDAIAKGLVHALEARPDLVNLSMSWPPEAHGRILRELFAKLREQGSLVVAAAGNDGSLARAFPCAEAGALCVGAHGPDGTMPKFSNAGESVDLLAPGVWILSAWPLALDREFYHEEPGYEFDSGTSMAAPIATGAAAWLLLRGVDREAVFPRLLRSARRDAGTPIGKLDLARAWNEGEAPWLGTPKKDPVTLSLAGEGEFEIAFELRNSGMAAKRAVALRALLTAEDGTPEAGVELLDPEIRVPALATDGTASLLLRARLLSARASGRLSLRLESADGRQVVRFPVELETRVGRAAGVAKTIQGTLLSGDDVRWIPVEARDGSSPQDTALFLRRERETVVQILEERESAFHAHEPIRIPDAFEGGKQSALRDLQGVQRVRPLAGGPARYAAWFERVEGTKDGNGKQMRLVGTELRMLDGGAPVLLEYRKSRVSPPVVWVRDGGGPGLLPAWIGSGPTPEKDLPPHDPWKPFEDDPPGTRVFFLEDERTLREARLVDPRKEVPVLLFPQTEEELSRGEARVLVARVDRELFRYELRVLRNGRLEGAEPVTLSPYRGLLNLPFPLPVRSAGDSDADFGGAWAFVPNLGRSLIGGARVTAIDRAGRQLDLEFPARDASESWSAILGVFAGGLPGARVSAFAMNAEELVYREDTGLEARTSLRNFSYRGADTIRESYFPYSIGSAESSPRLPAIFVPEGLGDVLPVAEWVVPNRTASGDLRLVRPVKLRTRLENGCEWVGDPRERGARAPVELWFRCGSEILSLPIRY